MAKLLITHPPEQNAAVIENLYLATLSRTPTAEELQTVQTLLGDSPSRKEALEDLLWTLLNTGEFVFNH